MAFSDCPQADLLTRSLVEAYQRTSDQDIESSSVIGDLQAAIMEHKSNCVLCRRILLRGGAILGAQRVA